MATKKTDLIIEAAHYEPNGKIAYVRAFERRGAIWSDVLLLPRSELVARLASGCRVCTGRRQPYLGSWLEPDQPLHFAQDTLFTNQQEGAGDLLPGLPVF